MYGEIVFYTHGSTIEYGGEIFPAGELTADILNFAPEDYRPIQRLLDRMKELSKQYEDTLDRGVWWELNNQLIELRSQLMRYRVFQILLREDDQFLNETQQYTESYSFFTDEEMDEQECSKDRWLEMYRQKEEEGWTPPFLLIVDGGREDKWRYYKLQMARYQRYIDDVIVFNPTIHNFINFLLSKLKRNSPEEYAAALYQFYNDERLVEKLIVNPTSLERPFYQKYDPCVVSYLPRELPDGTFAIAQEHTTDSLQMLLKADFMTALNAGIFAAALSAKNIFWFAPVFTPSTVRGAARWMSASPAGSMAAMTFKKNWHGMYQKSRPRSLPLTVSERIISEESSQRRKCGG